MTRALLALALALAACGRRPEVAGEQRQEMEDLVLRQTEDGRPAWSLRATRAVLREDDAKVDLQAPVMEFHRRGKAVSRVDAISGEVDARTHDVRLSSSVALESFDDDSRLTTEELLYSSAKKRFTTDREVVVRRPDATLRGRGLDAAPDLSEIRIFDQRTEVRERPRR